MESSEAENRLVWGLYEIPIPQKEYRFDLTRGWRFDYAWPDRFIAVEIEGGVRGMGRHNRAQGFIKDMEKYNAATRQGWRLFRFLPRELKTGQAQAFMKGVVETPFLFGAAGFGIYATFIDRSRPLPPRSPFAP